MSQALTTDLLQDFIQTKLLGGQSVGAEDDLLLSGLIDSLGVMTLVSFIEETQGAKIPPEDVTLENFTSVATILSYLDAR